MIGIRVPQPVAFRVDQHQMVTDWAGTGHECIQHRARGDVDNQYAPNPAGAAEYRRRHPQGGFVRHLDLAVVHVQIKRRNESLARFQLHGLGEEVAIMLVLQPLRRHDHRPMLAVVHTHPLHAVLVYPAHLVVTGVARHQQDKGFFHRRRVGAGLVHVNAFDRFFGQQAGKMPEGNREFFAQAAATQIDIGPFIGMERMKFCIDPHLDQQP